jgi:O-antigen/teichoic acid export membrane protein
VSADVGGAKGRLAKLAAALGGGAYLRETAGFASSTFFEQGARFLTGLVVAGLLGPETWGYWFLLNLVLSYGSLLHLGVLNGMNREVPAAHGRGEAARAAWLERVALGALLASIAVSALALSALSTWSRFRASVPLDYGALMLGLLAGHQLYTFAVTRGRSRVRFGYVSRLQTVFSLLHTALGIGGAAAWGLKGFIVGQTLAYLGTVAVGGLFGMRLPRPTLAWPEWRRLVGIGLPLMLVGVAHTFFTTVDRWVIAAYLGPEALGHYSLAVMAVSATRLLPQVFAQQTYPRMAAAWSARQDAHELRRLGRRQSLLTYATAALVTVPGALIAPWAVRAWLPEYVPGIGALLVSLAVPFATGLASGYGNVLNVIGRQALYLTLIVGATAVNAAGSLLLVGPLGLEGVALGTVLGFLTLSLGLLILGGRSLEHAKAQARDKHGASVAG